MPDRADAFIAHQQQSQGADQQVTDPAPVTPTPTEVIDPTAQETAPDTSEDATTPPVGQDTEVQETEPTAPGEGEGEGEPEDNVAAEDLELDDESLGTLWDAYGDKFMERESFKDRVSKLVSEQVQDQVRTQSQAQESQGEVAKMVEQGKQAVDRLKLFADNVGGELQKAVKEQEFSADINADAYKKDLFDYGQAIVAEVGSRYDGAIQTSISENLGKFPPLSEPDQQAFMKIIETAHRMELDKQQAPQSKGYFLSAVVSFLVDRALETGAVKGQELVVKTTEARRKVAEQSAVKKAAAKMAKDRGDIPPKTPAAMPETHAPGGEYDSDYYRGLKREGKFAEAQEYVDRHARGRVTIAP